MWHRVLPGGASRAHGQFGRAEALADEPRQRGRFGGREIRAPPSGRRTAPARRGRRRVKSRRGRRRQRRHQRRGQPVVGRGQRGNRRPRLAAGAARSPCRRSRVARALPPSRCAPRTPPRARNGRGSSSAWVSRCIARSTCATSDGPRPGRAGALVPALSVAWPSVAGRGPGRRHVVPRAPAMPTPTARRHVAKASCTSASQNSTRTGAAHRRPAWRDRAPACDRCPASRRANGMPAACQPATTWKAGPTMRTRCPPFSRHRYASMARQYSPADCVGFAVASRPLHLARPRAVPRRRASAPAARRSRRRRRHPLADLLLLPPADRARRRRSATTRATRRAASARPAARPAPAAARQRARAARRARRRHRRRGRLSASSATARAAISGGYALGRRLTPMPTTTAQSAPPIMAPSARMPASLRGGAPAASTTTSFGHFSVARMPVASAIASTAATPAITVSRLIVGIVPARRAHRAAGTRPRRRGRLRAATPRRGRDGRGPRSARRRRSRRPRARPGGPRQRVVVGRARGDDAAVPRERAELSRAASSSDAGAAASWREGRGARVTTAAAGSISKLMSTAGAECVSAPTDTNSAPCRRAS